jgi:hypothetical protein
MIHAPRKSLDRALFAAGFLLIGSIFVPQQQAAPQKAKIESKSEKREGDERKLILENLPKAVRAAIQKETQGAQIVNISKEIDNGKTLYEIETRAKAFSRDMLIDETGNLIEIEEEIALASLPLGIQPEIKKSIGKARLIKLEAVYNGAKVRNGYAALLDSAGKHFEVSLGLDGKPLPPDK